MRKKKDIFRAFMPLLILLLSFLGVTLFSMIYMAKDNNYDNILYQYFNISKELYGRLIYLDVSKETLIRGMNLCSLLFFFGNYLLFYFTGLRRERRKRMRLLIVLVIFWMMQAVVYSISFQKLFYFGKFGFYPDVQKFRNFYKLFHGITMSANFSILIIGCTLIMIKDLGKEQIPELYRIKRTILLTEVCLIGLYFYLYFSLPDSFLWISRSTGYIAYQSLKMGPYVSGMRLITWLIAALLILLCYNLYRYRLTSRRVREEEYVFSSIIASSEISTRAFSHYVKNELLGIMAEMDDLTEKFGEQIQEMENIKNTCENIYDRLNTLQKNSNRIVLNQSKQNIVNIITTSVEENKKFVMKNGCDIIWDKRSAGVEVFLDGYYIGEVFRNLFQNAVEAMKETDGQRLITVLLHIYSDEVEIKVQDTGPGFSASVQGRLFDPFVSTKSTKLNWGIGLSFCKRIISSHRGRIIANNLESGGAEIKIFLPIIEEDGK